jgi:hypothetical protein
MRVNVSYYYRNWIHYNKHAFSTDNAIAFAPAANSVKLGFNSRRAMRWESTERLVFAARNSFSHLVGRLHLVKQSFAIRQK